jgi:hypothetical protein
MMPREGGARQIPSKHKRRIVKRHSTLANTGTKPLARQHLFFSVSRTLYRYSSHSGRVLQHQPTFQQTTTLPDVMSGERKGDLETSWYV